MGFGVQGFTATHLFGGRFMGTLASRPRPKRRTPAGEPTAIQAHRRGHRKLNAPFPATAALKC